MTEEIAMSLVSKKVDVPSISSSSEMIITITAITIITHHNH